MNFPQYLGQGHGKVANRDAFHQHNYVTPKYKVIVREKIPSIVPILGPLIDEVVLNIQ